MKVDTISKLGNFFEMEYFCWFIFSASVNYLQGGFIKMSFLGVKCQF